jgi:hypothetical protein
LVWRVAGYYGFDRFLLPVLGTPEEPGRAFKRSDAKSMWTQTSEKGGTEG